MTVLELAVTVAAAAAIAAAAALGWTRLATAAGGSEELDEVVSVAAEYHRQHCDALPGARTPVATLAAAIGRPLALEDAAEWEVQYRTTGPTGFSRRGGTSFDVILDTPNDMRRAGVARRGGVVAGTAATVSVATARGREHRGRRYFVAELQEIAQC